MQLLIDLREPKSIIKYITSLNEVMKNKITLIQKNLDLGDYVFYDEVNNKPLLIIERKSLSDLEASIKDGRYKEQSYRLNESPIHNHNVIYLLEGAIINYKDANFKNTLYSTLFSLNYYKGFSVINVLNQIETGDLLMAIASKLIRENRSGFYNDLSNSVTSYHPVNVSQRDALMRERALEPWTIRVQPSTSSAHTIYVHKYTDK